MRRITHRALLVLGLLAGLALPASAQNLKVLTAGAFKQVVLAFVPAFEARTGVKVEVENDTAGALLKRVQAGEPFDVLIVPPGTMDALPPSKVDGIRIVPVARVAIGVAVARGAPKPPLQTVEEFKKAVLAARKVAYIDPASGGSSGVYLEGLFRRLGIADEVRAKAVLVPGGLVAERIARGEADLAIHQVSEILPVPGVELAGLLPESIQNYTTYSVAVALTPRQPVHARAFLEALTAPSAAEVIRAKGMLTVH